MSRGLPTYTPPLRSRRDVGRGVGGRPIAAGGERRSRQSAPKSAGRPIEMSPRTVAPEKRIDLSALRELANLSAQSAISRYSRKVLISSMYAKLMVAGVALAAGGATVVDVEALGARR